MNVLNGRRSSGWPTPPGLLAIARVRDDWLAGADELVEVRVPDWS
jgi:hypothetical protein